MLPIEMVISYDLHKFGAEIFLIGSSFHALCPYMADLNSKAKKLGVLKFL